jgi:hypothetical protein
VHHLHFLTPSNASQNQEFATRDGETQTFANLTMLRRSLDPGGLLRYSTDGRWSGGPVKIVSGIRDPIDRAASLLFFFADFYGNKTVALSFREGARADDLVSYFIETWRAALIGDMGSGTFDQRLRRAFLRYREWFSTELQAVFGIDVEHHAFDRERRSLVIDDASAAPVFSYRFEDMQPPAWPRVAAAASDFLGARIEALPRLNATGARRSHGLYADFKQRLAMPGDLLDRIYAAPIMEHFYTVEEIAGFKRRWGAGRRGDLKRPATASG